MSLAALGLWDLPAASWHRFQVITDWTPVPIRTRPHLPWAEAAGESCECPLAHMMLLQTIPSPNPPARWHPDSASVYTGLSISHDVLIIIHSISPPRTIVCKGLGADGKK